VTRIDQDWAKRERSMKGKGDLEFGIWNLGHYGGGLNSRNYASG
jgi:hypothetical protein